MWRGSTREASNLAFLFTFAVVCGLAFHERAGMRWFTGAGAVAGSAAVVALVVRLARTDPPALVALGALVLLAVAGRPLLLRRTRTLSRDR